MFRSMSSRVIVGSLVTAGLGSGYLAYAPRVYSAAAGPKRAVCVLNPDGNSGVEGVVHFSQSSPNAPTTITARVTGLSDGQHGFHVHAWGNLTQGCTTAGPHFNPFNKSHGGPQDEERHVGDLGNITSQSGVATYSTTDKLITLYGEHSIIGRSMVVHADPDDLGRGGYSDSKTTGHAGARKVTVHTPIITSIPIQSSRYTLSSHTIPYRSFSTHTGRHTPTNNITSPDPQAAKVVAPTTHIPTKPIIQAPRATITDDVNRPPPSHYTKTQTERAAVVHSSPKHPSPKKKPLKVKRSQYDDDDLDNPTKDTPDEEISHNSASALSTDEIQHDLTKPSLSKEDRWKLRLKSSPQAQEQRLQRARERELDKQRAKLKKTKKEEEF